MREEEEHRGIYHLNYAMVEETPARPTDRPTGREQLAYTYPSSGVDRHGVALHKITLQKQGRMLQTDYVL